MEDLWKNGGVAIAAGLIYLIEKLSLWVQKRKQAKLAAEKAERSGLENVNLIDRQVKHVLKGMLIRYMPIRVFVMHFHNGTFTEAGLSLQRLTIKHEVRSSYRVMQIETTHQEQPVPEFLYTLISRVRMFGFYALQDTNDLLQEQLPFKEWLEYYELSQTHIQ
jgi:hypothetical protein